MDIRNALASQSYATAKTAVAPAPKQGGVEGGFAQMAGNFTNTLMQGEQTARAAMTGGPIRSRWWPPSPHRKPRLIPWQQCVTAWSRRIKKFCGCQCKGQDMTEATIFDILRQGLWVSVMISTPLLAVALIMGVVVGLFQALTSIQEMTLTFVPKVGAMLLVFWVSMSFMTATLVAYFQDQLIPMIAGG